MSRRSPSSPLEEMKQTKYVTSHNFANKQDAPPWYIQAVENFLKTNPMDVHFIMEFGQEGKSVGGNGFGSVTCEYLPFLPSSFSSLPSTISRCANRVGMEDYCWEVS